MPSGTPHDPSRVIRLLSIDTSTERLQVALQVGDRLHRADAPGGPQASATLLPQVGALLREAGIAVADLDAIGFAHGPGAFTGLRVACSVAQGLALGSNRPVLPLDSLLVVAEDARHRTLGSGAGVEPLFDVWVVMDARMGEVYAAAYGWDAGAWRVLDSPALWQPADLVHRMADRPAGHVAGSALEALREPLAPAVSRMPAHCCFAHPLDRAGALARVALMAWRQGGALPDAAQALPLYLRDRVALTTAERDARRLAGATSSEGR